MTILILKAVFIGVCLLFFFNGNHPPAIAQDEPRITVKDAIQDHDIASLNEHLRSTDIQVDQQRIQINANSLSIAESQGEQRAFTVVLGLLSTVSIVIQIKGKKTV